MNLPQTHRKLWKPHHLIIKGQTISQVALDTGFSGQSHLGRYFKRFLGVTPGQYVKDSQSGG
ncbi:MAG: helix-turn-helix domain-containing protein [Cyanobacteria bacterium P01_A01_bin.114]